MVVPLLLYGFTTGSTVYAEIIDRGCFGTKCSGMLFGPSRDEVKRELRKLHNKEHHNIYCFF